MHDPRIGRFLSIDPITSTYPYNSPYAFAENKVISGKELEGLEVIFFGEIPPWMNVAMESNNILNRVAPLAEQLPAKNMVESSVETGVARPGAGASWYRWLAFGRAVHKEQLAKWVEEGFKIERSIGKENRLDGIKIEKVGDVTKGIIRELKPNSEWGQKAGIEQLTRYLEAAKKEFPQVEEWSLELFKYYNITGVNYTVQESDNLSSIAKKFSINTENLKLLNNIQDGDKIKKGENLLVGVEVKPSLSKPTSKPLNKKEQQTLMNFIKNVQKQGQSDKKQ